MKPARKNVSIFHYTALIFVGLAIVLSPSCETSAQNTALGTAGFGSLIGGLAGGWQGAAIGAASGAMAGGVVGNEADEARAQKQAELDKSGRWVAPDTANPLAGTNWKVLRAVGDTDAPKYESMVVAFGKNGEMASRINYADGRHEIVRERYRVAEYGLMITTASGVVIHAQYNMTATTLVITNHEFEAVLQRL